MTLAAAAGLSAGCQQMEEMRTLAPGDVRPPVLNPLGTDAVVVTEDNLDETVTFVWDAADFGVRAQVSYTLEAEYEDAESGETRRVSLQSGITATSLEMTYETLNYTIGLAADMGGLGVPLETPSPVDFYVGASLGNSSDIYYSQPAGLTMTVIYAEPRYPNVWVIGKYSNWEHARSQYLFSFDNNAEFEGIIDFGENAAENNGGTADDIGFKLTGAANWNNATGNWGLGAERPEAEADEVTLINNGGNISNVYTKRYYSFAYNTTTLALTKQYSFDRLVVYGTAVGDAEQTMLFNTSEQEFYIDATLVEGNLNFALVDGAERTVLGSATSGMLDGSESNPIAAAAGNYRIYVNLNNSEEKTYEFNADDYGKEIDEGEEITDPTGHTWGICGTMNNWGNAGTDGEVQPDLAMVLDGDYYVRRNVSLTTADLFKVRYDNAWNDDSNNPTNYGTSADFQLTPADNSTYMAAALVSNGNGNLSVTADGSYDIYFNVDNGYLHVRPAESPAPGAIGWGLVGSFTDWLPGEDLPMTAATGDGQEYYVYEGLDLEEAATFKFRYGNMFRDGSDNTYGLPAGTAGNVTLNAPVNLDADGGSADLSVAAGVYNIVLYPTQRVAYIIEQDADVNVPDRITWGITGTMTGWADNMDKLMSQADGYYVLKNLEVTADGAEFKFRYGNNWDGANYGFASTSSVSASENVIALVSGGSGNLKITAEGNYDLYLNPDYGFAYVMTAGTPAPAVVSFGINAGITLDMPDLTMAQSGNEFVCNNVRFPEADQFRIRVSNNDGITYGGTWNGVNVPIQAVEGGSSISVPAGLYDIYFNYGTKEIRVVGTSAEPQWGIIGTFSGWANDRIMTAEDGYLVYKGLTFDTDNEPTGNGDSNAFKFRYGWNWDLGSIGYAGSAFEVTVNAAVPVVNDSGSGNLIVPSAGTYDIYLDLSNMQVWVMTSGMKPGDQPLPTVPQPDPAPAFNEELLNYKAVGVHNGWSDDIVTNHDDLGLLYWTGLTFAEGSAEGGHFKIKLAGPWDNATTYGVPGGTSAQIGVPLNVSNANEGGSSNIAVPERNEPYDVYFDFRSKVIYLVNSGETDILKWGLVGEMTGWGTDSDIQVTEEMSGYPGVYIWKDVALNAREGFKIRCNSSYNHQYSVGATLADRTKITVYSGSADNMTVSESGTYDIYFDYPNEKVWVVKK